jgi:hypothetical protein
MNLVLCRLSARDAGSGTCVLIATLLALKRWALIYRPCRDGLYYPNTLCLSIVTPDFRNSVMNSCSNVHFL